jgi:galactose mutarotase-like enzyme
MTATITSGDLTVTIKADGAEISSIKNKAGEEFIWQANKEIWPRHAPVLFPIVGKLKNEEYNYHEKSYRLGQHGFARDMKFVVTEAEADWTSLRLTNNSATEKVFPFPFVFDIGYLLQGSTVHVVYKVQNPSDNELFFSVGGHPGFNCPVTNGEVFEDHYLQFEGGDLIYTSLKNGLRSSEKKVLKLDNGRLFLTASLFDHDALVFESGQIGTVSLCSKKSGEKVKMDCKSWPYFGIWSKKGNRDFICLEPWYGITDHESATGELPEKEGIIRLAGGEDFKCAYKMTFS